MDNKNAIELIKNILPKKVSYANLVGASNCYGDKYVYEDPEPYALEMAILSLEKTADKNCSRCINKNKCAIFDNFNIDYCSDWRVE